MEKSKTKEEIYRQEFFNNYGTYTDSEPASYEVKAMQIFADQEASKLKDLIVVKTEYYEAKIDMLNRVSNEKDNEFGKYIEKWMTYVQLAFYADGLEAIHGVPFNTAFVIAVEKNAPFVVQPYYLADDDIELGRTIYRSLLEKHAKCVEKGAWGGYEANYQPDSDNCINGVIISHLPGWAKIKAESTEFIQNSNK